MERNKEQLIEKICNEQNFEELLLEIMSKKENNKINKILTYISESNRLDEKQKREIYGDFFDYLKEINQLYIDSLKDVFCLGVKKALEEINNEKGLE